jgi:hypothetical protein
MAKIAKQQEMEDSDGNVYPADVFAALVKQGIITPAGRY